jgi:hypothetical protein
VEPVVEEVHPEPAGDPCPGRTRGDREETITVVDAQIACEKARLQEDARDLLEDPAGEVVDRVVEPIVALLLPPGEEGLDPDEQEEDGDGEDDEVQGRGSDSPVSGLPRGPVNLGIGRPRGPIALL